MATKDDIGLDVHQSNYQTRCQKRKLPWQAHNEYMKYKLRSRTSENPLKQVNVTNCDNIVHPMYAMVRNNRTPNNINVIQEPFNMISLPNEILTKIFQELSFDDLFNVEKVCSRFLNITRVNIWPRVCELSHETIVSKSSYPLFKRRHIIPDTYSSKHHLTNNSVNTIFKRANISKVDLRYYARSITYQVSGSFKYIPHLSSLNLSGIRLTNSCLRTIARYCCNLDTVIFVGCFSDGKVESGLSELFSNCENLHYINLANNNKLYGECFSEIPVQVYYLNVASCYNITAAALDILIERVLRVETLVLENLENGTISHYNTWLKRLPYLRNLEISSLFLPPEATLDFSECTNLEKLCFRYNTAINFEAIRSLRFCRDLWMLDIRFCHNLDADSFLYLRRFESLDFCEFTQKLNICHYINLINCAEISRVAFHTIGSKIPHIPELLRHCPGLRRIDLYRNDGGYSDLEIAKVFDVKIPVCDRNLISVVFPPKTRLANAEFPRFPWCQVIVRCDNFIAGDVIQEKIRNDARHF